MQFRDYTDCCSAHYNEVQARSHGSVPVSYTHLEQVKQLIALRKEPAARSMEITFENNNSSDRVVEYVKTGAEGSRLRVVLNASGKETDVETEGSVLFARGYENRVPVSYTHLDVYKRQVRY